MCNLCSALRLLLCVEHFYGIIMRVYLSRFMLAFYLLLALAPQWLEEFAKFPALMAHYQDHRQENPAITLGKFLSQHYGTDYAKHCNQHDHSKLPGKTKHHDSCMHMNVTGDSVLPFHADLVASPHNWEEPKNSSVFQHDQNPGAAHLSGIWQPPRA